MKRKLIIRDNIDDKVVTVDIKVRDLDWKRNYELNKPKIFKNKKVYNRKQKHPKIYQKGDKVKMNCKEKKEKEEEEIKRIKRLLYKAGNITEAEIKIVNEVDAIDDLLEREDISNDEKYCLEKKKKRLLKKRDKIEKEKGVR